ncbi:MAG: methyltransferase domain-containing protein [Bacteroidota bacterium]
MLKHRSTELEIMDDLSISGEVIHQTLRELNTINRRLGGNKISVSAFREMIKNQSAVTLADLGCGGGDIMVEMAQATRKVGCDAKFIGIDANEHIVDYAENNTREYTEISYQAINIFSNEFKVQTFDIIHCCLFVHHFPSEQLVALFKQFKKQARLGVFFNTSLS